MCDRVIVTDSVCGQGGDIPHLKLGLPVDGAIRRVDHGRTMWASDNKVRRYKRKA